jgi:2,4-dienoyl-CoA reductase-like NADH-dependent reductase (Old Yellow Enzyme family)
MEVHMNHKGQFEHLFTPVQIGSLELKNRLLMLPMENSYSAEDGSVTERLTNYYTARAKDVGLVIVQITCVDAPIGHPVAPRRCPR